MKKVLSIVICGILVIGIVGCGKKETKDVTTKEKNTSSETTTKSESKTNEATTKTETSNKTSDATSKTKVDYSSYVGVWGNIDSKSSDEEVIIKSVENDKVTFDYAILKTASFENVIATLTGDTASFNVTGDTEANIKGTIKFSNNSVILTIEDVDNENVEKTTKTFTSKYEKSLLQ